MSDEQKTYSSANWIIKLAKKSYTPGINAKPLYLTKDKATPLLALGVITELYEA